LTFLVKVVYYSYYGAFSARNQQITLLIKFSLKNETIETIYSKKASARPSNKIQYRLKQVFGKSQRMGLGNGRGGGT
jgi:hypothetical protein